MEDGIYININVVKMTGFTVTKGGNSTTVQRLLIRKEDDTYININVGKEDRFLYVGIPYCTV
jgi:hypothetical protein